MNQRLNDNLDAVFSLLPRKQAEEAKRETFEQYASRQRGAAEELKWAEFDLSGRFLRGGSSNPSDLATHIFTNSQEDADVHDLARRAVEGGIEAGLLEPASPGQDRLHWFVPFTPTKSDKLTKTRLRGLSITYALFSDVMEMFNPIAGLSTTEKRVIFQTIAGASLREAASTDGVSYETKRFHVKSACEKLSCTGQKDLVRKVLGQMVHLLSLSDSEAVHADIAESFVSRFLSNDVRMSVQRLRSGRLMRFLESGPAEGRPVVMIHGMMFPISLFGIAEHLHAAGIRLIVPIRDGYLESRSTFSLYKEGGLLTGSLEDIAEFLRQSCQTPAIILGNSLGGVAAIRFAGLYPDLVSNLVLLSINLTRTQPSTENIAGTFYGGLRALSDRPDLFKFVNWQFRKYYGDEKTCRDILLRLFGSSEPDVDVLEGKFSNVRAYPMFSETYQSSTLGIIDDFGFVMNSWQQEVAELPMPVTFIHGRCDPLTRIEEFGAMATLNRANRIIVVETGGHFVSVSHAREVWGHVSRVAAGDRTSSI